MIILDRLYVEYSSNNLIAILKLSEKKLKFLLGKTHLAVGVAASLLFTQPKSLQELVLAVGIGGIGSLIPDIDVETSGSHKYINKIIIFAVLASVGIFVAEKLWNIGIVAQILSDSNYIKIAIGAILFILVCAFGKRQPHRSFMHSILALVILSISVGLIWIDLVPCFAIGFISHLLTDIFNYKRVRLFYPFKGGIALKLFHAHGLANSIFLLVGSVLTIFQVVFFTYNIIFT